MPIRRLPSGRYQAKYLRPDEPYDADGKRNYIAAPATFRTKTDAKHWLTEVQADISRGTWVSPEQLEAEKVAAKIAAKRDALTFGDYATDWLAGRKLRPTTHRSYESMLRNHLMPRWGSLPLKAITTPEIRAWLAELAPGSPVVRDRAFELFRTILLTAVEDDLLAMTPIKRDMTDTVAAAPARESRERHPRRKPRALSSRDLDALANAVPEYLRLPVLLAGTVGLRSGELRALTGGSLESLPGGIVLLHVTQAVTGHGSNVSIGPPKTDASMRIVPVPASLQDDIEDLAAKVGSQGLLFSAQDDPDRVMPERTFQGALAAGGERAGIGHVRPHDLRHTAISQAVAAGAASTEIRDLVGHRTTSMTGRYTHTDAARLASVVALIDRARTEPQPDNVLPLARRQA